MGLAIVSQTWYIKKYIVPNMTQQAGRVESMIKIMDAARYLIYLSYHQRKCSLTPLKLQKLLYLAQGWSYVWDDEPLFKSRFAAWQYGPVNEEIYNHFKVYGRNEIPESEGLPNLFDTTARATLEAVWDRYCRGSAFELVEITHEQEPWRIAYEERRDITNSEIQRYFQSTY